MNRDTSIVVVFPRTLYETPGPVRAWINDRSDYEPDRHSNIIVTLWGGEIRWDDPDGGSITWCTVPKEVYAAATRFRIAASEHTEYLGGADFRRQVVCRLNGAPEHHFFTPQQRALHSADAYYSLSRPLVTGSYRSSDGLIEIVRYDLLFNPGEHKVGLRGLRLWFGHNPRRLPPEWQHFRKALAAVIGKATGDVPPFAYPERIGNETLWYDDPAHIEQVFRHWEENQRRDETRYHYPDSTDRWDPAATSFERL